MRAVGALKSRRAFFPVQAVSKEKKWSGLRDYAGVYLIFDIVIAESVTISGDTPYVVYSDLFGGLVKLKVKSHFEIFLMVNSQAIISFRPNRSRSKQNLSKRSACNHKIAAVQL